jgi:DNA-binding NtrC family response regulator
MPPLLHDRYLMIDAGDACDLATGQIVPIDRVDERPATRTLLLPALTEVLEHGRDGSPRAVVVDVRSSAGWTTAADQIGAEAAGRGYVPVAVDLYARLQLAIPDELAQRTLLLIGCDRGAARARAAFLDVATRSPRPHVLVTLRSNRRVMTPVVREAKAAYGTATRSRPVAILSGEVQQLLQRARRATEFVASGRHAAAERLLRDVGGALTRRAAWAPAVNVFVSLGRLLLERGRPADAGRAFCDAIAAAGSAGDEQLATDARIWLATARTDDGQLTAAESICRSLLLVAGLSEPQLGWARAALSRVLLWQDRTPEALSLMARFVLAGESRDEETEAFTRSMRIRLLLRTGRSFDAGVEAGELLATCGQTPIARTIALTAQLRISAAAGDLVGARHCFTAIAATARAARSPLRLARARLIFADCLQRAGRSRDAERQLRALSRVARVAPALLRQGIERRVAEARHGATGPADLLPVGRALGDADVSAAALVQLSQDEDDDHAAVERLLAAALRRMHATRIDLWSCDAGPATIVLSSGTGVPSTIGARVLDAGIAIGPERSDPPQQFGVPVRIGTRLVGACVARWAIDREPPAEAQGVLELLAAVAGPRVDAYLHRARTEAEASSLIPELVGAGRAMTEVRQAVARAALAPFSVLVEGESGTGKELIARAIHYLSPRRERRFCDVNCAALPDDLIESELFGHARGAFTGAIAERAGLFEEAHGGTLFLDEIADLSLRAQAKLLRTLQQQEIRRVGEAFARPVDVRLVAAANRDMRAEAANGRFRQDLLYRVDVIRISVPALRDRPEDIPALAQHFWRTAAERVGTVASLSPGVIAALAGYHWPGNVRELQNVVAALAVAAPRRGQVRADVLPAAVSGSTRVCATRLADARDQFERRFVEVALARAGGNRARAARALGLSRQGLLKLMERLHVEKI